MTDTIIRALCVGDTIHDFGSALKDNQYYQLFMTRNRQIFYDFIGKEPLNCTNSIEDDVIAKLQTDDTNLNTMFKNKSGSDIGPKLFSFMTDDVNNDEFKKFLGAVAASGTGIDGEKFGNIHFITDTNKLSNETLCSIQYASRKGYMIISEATDYDRGQVQTEDANCVHRHSIDVSMPTLNLFGLDSIRLYTDRDTHQRHIAYNFMQNGVQHNVLLNTSNFIVEQKTASARNLSLYKNIISGINDKTTGTIVVGGASKRKTVDDAEAPGRSKKKQDQKIPLEVLLDDIHRVYGLDHKLFNFYINKKIVPGNAEKFISILFDFKRAGDQLQVLSAKASNSIFISNDRMALMYAYLRGMPCIKTTLRQSSGENIHSNRKLTFYNFNQKTVIEDIIDGKGFYQEIIKQTIENTKSYLEHVKRIPAIISITKIKAALENSLNVLSLNDIPLRDISKSNAFDQQPPVYIYKYIHIYNVLLHLIILNIKLHIDEMPILQQNLATMEQTFARIDASTDINTLKSLSNMGQDISNFAKFLNLSDTNNLIFLIDIINLYNTDVVPAIIYDGNTVVLENIANLNQTEFYNYMNTILSTFVKSSQITILRDMYKFITSWYQTHKLIPSGKPNIRFFKDGKTADIYLDNEWKLLRIKNDANDIKMLLGEYETFIDDIARRINISMSKIKIYKGGKDATVKKPLITNILNKFIAPVEKNKGETVKNKQKSKSQQLLQTPLDLFISELDKIYDRNTNEDQMAILLIIFMVKSFNVFDHNGDIGRNYATKLTQSSSIKQLSAIAEEKSSNKSSNSSGKSANSSGK